MMISPFSPSECISFSSSDQSEARCVQLADLQVGCSPYGGQWNLSCQNCSGHHPHRRSQS